MSCIITGCALVHGNAWVAGDLYMPSAEGDTLVFVGNQQNGEPVWIYSAPQYSKRLEPFSFWDKRGIFVIRKDQANLNQAALDYIGRAP